MQPYRNSAFSVDSTSFSAGLCPVTYGPLTYLGSVPGPTRHQYSLFQKLVTLSKYSIFTVYSYQRCCTYVLCEINLFTLRIFRSKTSVHILHLSDQGLCLCALEVNGELDADAELTCSTASEEVLRHQGFSLDLNGRDLLLSED